jgi:cyclase
LKRRLIPVLFLQNGLMVRSETFAEHLVIGHPVSHVERLTEWDVDELIILDISREGGRYEINRDDHKLKGSQNLLEFIARIAETCAVPLTFGGQVRSLEDVHVRIRNGADKVTLNTALIESAPLVEAAARAFGSQAIVASIDYRVIDGRPRVFYRWGREDSGHHPVDLARAAADLGAGEILLNAIDRDGRACGYDHATIDAVCRAVEIPVIACGGAGHQSHFRKCLEETGAAAVAAGNIFHFTENAYPRAKKYLRANRQDVR